MTLHVPLPFCLEQIHFQQVMHFSVPYFHLHYIQFLLINAQLHLYYSTTHKSILVLLCMHCVGVCCRQVSGKFLNGSLLFARFPSKLMSSCTKFKCNTKMDIKLIYFQSFASCPISLFPIKCKFIYPCSCLFCFSSCCEILGAFFFFLILLTR